MKKPFIFALVAAVYIVLIVLAVWTVGSMFQNQKETILMPITMLGVFVLSVAVMGYLFFSEPLRLYFDGKKHEAIFFFAKVVGIFACFVALSVILLFLI